MDRSPLPAEACPFIGHAYRKLGKYDQALAAFERCFEADTRNAELAFFVGLGNEWMSKFETAAGVVRARHRHRPAALRQRGRPGPPATAPQPPGPGPRPGAGGAEARADARRRRARRRPGGAARRASAPRPATYLEKAAKLSEDYFDVQLALGVLDYSESRYKDARGRFEIASRLDATRRDEVQPWLDRTANVKVSQ